MPALRIQLVDIQQSTPVGTTRYTLPVDCWQWWISCSVPNSLTRWTINGVRADRFFGVDVTSPISSTMVSPKFGGIFDGHGRAVNFNEQLILVGDGGREFPCVLTKVYWDERLTDPDMPL